MKKVVNLLQISWINIFPPPVLGNIATLELVVSHYRLLFPDIFFCHDAVTKPPGSFQAVLVYMLGHKNKRQSFHRNILQLLNVTKPRLKEAEGNISLPSVQN